MKFFDITKMVEGKIAVAAKAVGFNKKQLDDFINTSGWIILAYVVLRMVNLNSKKGVDNG